MPYSELLLHCTIQHLASVLKKKVSVDKEHMKAVHKMTQSMHEDGSIKNLKFEG